jgi:hypothetical protein
LRTEVVLIRSNRLSLSIAGTAAVALASLPLDITPANAARASQGTTSNIGVVETSSNASSQEFNLGVQGGAATDSLDSEEMDRVSHSGHNHGGNKGKAKNKNKKGK